MCDLFALCAAHNYAAATSLPLFAVRGRRNVHGWGIGFFRRSHPVVEKSGEQVFREGQLHGSFQRLARVVASAIILAHIRYRSSGKVDECHAHPFILDFWGQSWIFAHNGKAGAIEPYQSRHAPTLEASSDSARTFEFLRDYFTDAAPRRRHTPFLQVLKEALTGLIQQYPGEYNLAPEQWPGYLGLHQPPAIPAAQGQPEAGRRPAAHHHRRGPQPGKLAENRPPGRAAGQNSADRRGRPGPGGRPVAAGYGDRRLRPNYHFDKIQAEIWEEFSIRHIF